MWETTATAMSISTSISNIWIAINWRFSQGNAQKDVENIYI